MLVTSNNSRGKTIGNVQDRLTKLYQLEAKYLCDNDQTNPVKVLLGRDMLSMTQLCPIWNIEKKKKKTSTKKTDIETGQIYYGGMAVSFCAGIVDLLYSIWNGDAEIYSNTGFGLATAGSYKELNISEYGTFRVYSGKPGQDVDPAFSNDIVIDDNADPKVKIEKNTSPAYKGICYFCSDRFKYGESNTTPNLRAELECQPKAFFDDLAGAENVEIPDFFPAGSEFSGKRQSVNNIEIPICDENGDTYPPLIIYEILRNTNWGSARFNALQIDIQSFVNALKVCYDEGITISAVFDSDTSVRDAISQVLDYADGVVYLNSDDQIAIELVRLSSQAQIPEIGTDALCDEPQIKWENVSEIWGCTDITFNDRDNKYESTSVFFECPGTTDKNRKKFDMPWIKTRAVANKVVHRLGFNGASQSIEVTLKLLPSYVGLYHVGDIFYFNFSKRFSVAGYFRINEIRIGEPANPEIQIVAVNILETGWQLARDNDVSFSAPSKAQPPVNTVGSWFAVRCLPNQDGKGLSVFLANEKNCQCKYYNITNKWGTFASGMHGSETILGQSQKFQICGQITNLSIIDDSTIEIQFFVADGQVDEATDIFNGKRDVFLACSAYRKTATNTYQAIWKQMRYKIAWEKDFTPSNTTLDGVTGKLYPFYATPVMGYECIDTKKGIYPSACAYLFEQGEYFEYRTEDTLYHSDLAVSDENKGTYIRIQPVFNRGETNSLNVFHYYLSGRGYNSTQETYYDLEACTATHPMAMGSGQNPESYDDKDSQGNRIDPWGGPKIPGSGTIIAAAEDPSAQVIPASESNEATIWINTVTGDTYTLLDGSWVYARRLSHADGMIGIERLPVGTTAGTVAAGNHLHDDRYQLIGQSAERYYIYREDSTAFQHESGQCGLIHVHITSETAITLPIPAASTAEDGDVITIIVTKDSNTTLCYITISSTNNFPNISASTATCATGEITHLVCSNSAWLIIQTSQLK